MMEETNLTIVPIKDMRYAGQLLDYARIEKRHQTRWRFSGLLLSLRLQADDWQSYLQQLNQAFAQQYGIVHSMDALPGMHDWVDHLRKNKLRHLVMLRIPRLTSIEVLVKLIQWATAERRESCLQMIIGVHEKMLDQAEVQQAMIEASEKMNLYTHDGQHHKFEPQFQRTSWRPAVTVVAGVMLAAISGLWFLV